jgi:hypothetical protein
MVAPAEPKKKKGSGGETAHLRLQKSQHAVAVLGPGNGASSIWNSDDDVAGVRVVADDLDRADRVVATSRVNGGDAHRCRECGRLGIGAVGQKDLRSADIDAPHPRLGQKIDRVLECLARGADRDAGIGVAAGLASRASANAALRRVCGRIHVEGHIARHHRQYAGAEVGDRLRGRIHHRGRTLENRNFFRPGQAARDPKIVQGLRGCRESLHQGEQCNGTSIHLIITPGLELCTANSWANLKLPEGGFRSRRR